MLKVLFLLPIVVATFGYDFKDSAFNEFVFDDMRDFTENLDDVRFKRETEVLQPEKCHHHKKDMYCCKSDKFDQKMYEAFREIKKECHKEIVGEDSQFDPFNCEKLKEIKESIICIGECISKKFNMLDDKGDLKRDLVLEHMKTKYADQPWKLEATETIIDKCIEVVKNSKKEEETKCNPASMQMVHCMWKEYVQKCPKDLQLDSTKCKKIRESIEKQDENYLKKIHFYRILKLHNHDVEKDDKDAN